MKHQTRKLMRRTTLSVLIGTLATQSVAWANLPIAQAPAGTSVKLPAPNVIISVDDSGSMGSEFDNGIETLKSALRETFSAANLKDGEIRLGWQSMHRCLGIPSASADCNSNNVLKVFSGQHRTRFMTWVDTLTASGGTPSHRVLRKAGDYLSRTDLGISSPWAFEPGVQEAPILSCRKSYHLFMTDGAWNGSGALTSDVIDGDRKTAGYKSDELVSPNGNIDGTARLLGDGKTTYNPFTAQTHIYSDIWGYAGSEGLNTLSDLAFYYWAKDLQPGIPNNVRPTYKVDGNETVAQSTANVTLDKAWNPKNNPATWQHMVTYSVGFGAQGTSWSGSPSWDGGTHKGTDYEKLILGLDTWPSPLCTGNTACDGAAPYGTRNNQRTMELWHMALNGRGLFVPARTAAELAPAFKTILNEIITDNSKPITSTASASTSLTRAGTNAYTAGYEAEKWNGYISASSIAQGSGAASALTGWSGKNTAEKLDALDASGINSRLILTWREGAAANFPAGPQPFKWADGEDYLSDLQKAFFLSTPNEAASMGEHRLNFIRGDRSKEAAGASPQLRQRKSRQGDIVNSRLWYVAQPASNHSVDKYASFVSKHKNRLPMIYVGGNDGMLHGFSAEDGSEKIAYVPKGVIPKLKLLTEGTYNSNHRYFVDGSPFVGDVSWGLPSPPTNPDPNAPTPTPDWRSLLVGTLGAGGKGYFVLDVTNPGSKAGALGGEASNFSEADRANLVLVDNTADSDTAFADTDPAQYLGNITVPPVLDDNNPFKPTQITRLNDGKWAAVLGNGYNSSAERPALLIQYLGKNAASRTLKVIPVPTTAKGGGNGLSAPRLVDLDGNGTADVVYAGDLKGNLWKFDLLSTEPSGWKVAFNDTPLFTAQHTPAGGTAVAQPITAPPSVRNNTRGTAGLMVAFGTGQNLTTTDRNSTTVQSIYSVRDRTLYKRSENTVAIDTAGVAITDGRTRLVAQTASSPVTNASDREYQALSANDVELGDGASDKQGWYFDLPVSGERLLDPMSFYDGSNVLEVVSEVPASGSEQAGETCDPQSRQARKFRTFLNIMDGKPPSIQIIDLNGDGYYNAAAAADKGVSRTTAPNTESRYQTKDTQIRQCNDGPDCPSDRFRKMPVLSIRPDWRQLQ